MNTEESNRTKYSMAGIIFILLGMEICKLAFWYGDAGRFQVFINQIGLNGVIGVLGVFGIAAGILFITLIQTKGKTSLQLPKFGRRRYLWLKHASQMKR